MIASLIEAVRHVEATPLTLEPTAIRASLSTWGVVPAVGAAGIATPARIQDLRSTSASNALAAGPTTFELARIMGGSVGMIEQHRGAPIDSAHDATPSTGGHVAMTELPP